MWNSQTFRVGDGLLLHCSHHALQLNLPLAVGRTAVVCTRQLAADYPNWPPKTSTGTAQTHSDMHRSIKCPYAMLQCLFNAASSRRRRVLSEQKFPNNRSETVNRHGVANGGAMNGREYDREQLFAQPRLACLL